MEWKPIETAPKDEEWMSDAPERGNGVGIAKGDNDGRHLFLVWWEKVSPFRWETTHWMPIPLGPKSRVKSVRKTLPRRTEASKSTA